MCPDGNAQAVPGNFFPICLIPLLPLKFMNGSTHGLRGGYNSATLISTPASIRLCNVFLCTVPSTQEQEIPLHPLDLAYGEAANMT